MPKRKLKTPQTLGGQRIVNAINGCPSYRITSIVTMERMTPIVPLLAQLHPLNVAKINAIYGWAVELGRCPDIASELGGGLTRIQIQELENVLSVKFPGDVYRRLLNGQTLPADSLVSVVPPLLPVNPVDGLQLARVPHSPSCLLDAVELSFENRNSPGLKKLVTDYYTSHRSEIPGIGEYPLPQDNQTDPFFEAWQEYITAVEEGRLDFNLMEIVGVEVVQRFVEGPIIVIQSDDNPIIPKNIGSCTAAPIFIYCHAHHGQKYYSEFYVHSDFDPNYILAAIRRNVDAGQDVRFDPPRSWLNDVGILADATPVMASPAILIQSQDEAMLEAFLQAIDTANEEQFREALFSVATSGRVTP